MRFFIDTAKVEDIKKANDMGVICGVTTNPSLIAKEGRDFKEVIKEITSIVDGPISGEVKATTVDAEGMIAEGREIAAIHPNMVVKIPMTVEGLKACKVLTAEGIKTNVTLIFTANQALLAARAGATYVSPFLGRIDDISGYGIDLVDPDGNPVADGVNGEICIKTSGDHLPCGLFLGYYQDEERTKAVWHDGWYHTGDLAWRDEDGFYWYVGRADDVIKSSGYRIGPFEIENVIMELPYVLECGVSAAPDEIRGQVVKASIVLVPGTEGTDELKKEIQNYVKKHTAPYKYPRIVVFRDELPKTISGKIIRNQL